MQDIESFGGVIYLKEYIQADKLNVIWNVPNKKNEKYLIFSNIPREVGLMTLLLTVIGWLRFAEKYGCRLIVDLRGCNNMYTDKRNENAWSLSYEQISGVDNIDRIKKEENYAVCPDITRWHYRHFDNPFITRIIPPKIIFPEIRDYKDNPGLNLEFGRIYESQIRLRPSIESYINTELELIKDKGTVLGVLVRGTDYVQGHPKGHPIQPTYDQIFEYLELKKNELSWDYIYLATDEYSAEIVFQEKYPGKIIVNKRAYYDEFDFQHKVLADVHLERENDNFLRGIEYLSSMVILSKCDSLIGGLCGGSQAALIMNNGKYKHVHMFDYGNY